MGDIAVLGAWYAAKALRLLLLKIFEALEIILAAVAAGGGDA